MKTVLGFDFGLKRIGTAIGQLVTCSASPLKTIGAKNGEPDWDEVKKLLEKWCPDALVVGIPLNMDGTEQKITQVARHFANELHKRFSLPVYMQDERLTTVAAREEVFAEKGYKGLQQTEIDSVAAKLILESWFSEYR